MWIDRGKLWLIWLNNMHLIYWSIRASSRKVKDEVKGEDKGLIYFS